jgi:hypothetical protein
VFHGKGGYSWETVYNMPIWLRKFTYQSIEEFYRKKQEAEEELQNKMNGVQKASSEKSPQIPDAVKKAAYTTKKQS